MMMAVCSQGSGVNFQPFLDGTWKSSSHSGLHLSYTPGVTERVLVRFRNVVMPTSTRDSCTKSPEKAPVTGAFHR